jgi:hypothetical protein
MHFVPYHLRTGRYNTLAYAIAEAEKLAALGLHNAVGKGFPPTVSGAPVLKLWAERFRSPKTDLTAKRAGVTIYFIFPHKQNRS